MHVFCIKFLVGRTNNVTVGIRHRCELHYEKRLKALLTNGHEGYFVEHFFCVY
jgi:hypothetical protein